MELGVKSHRAFAIACIGIAAWLGVTADARACSCIGDWSLFAPAGETHPSGAPIVFASSCGGSFDPWSVMVDGAPATLAQSAIDGEIATAAIMPTPAEGAEVVLMLDCSQVYDDPACAGSAR